MSKFRKGDKVQAGNGVEGEVVEVDSARRKVVVKAENDTVSTSRGRETVFFEGELRPAPKPVDPPKKKGFFRR